MIIKTEHLRYNEMNLIELEAYVDTLQLDQRLLDGKKIMSCVPKEALKISLEVEREAQTINYYKGISGSLVLKGSCLSIMGQYRKALEALERGIESASIHHDLDVVVAGVFSKGNIFSKIGDVKTALSLYQEGLTMSRQIKSEYEISFLNNISVIYSKTGQVDQALTYMENALTLARQRDLPVEGLILTNIAEIYVKKDNLEEALVYNQKADFVIRSFENTMYRVQCDKVYGMIYGYMGNHEKSSQFFEKAKAVCAENEDNYRFASILFESACVHAALGAKKEAVEIYLNSLVLSDELDLKVQSRDTLKKLATVYKELEFYKEAFDALERYVRLNEQIESETLENMLEAQALQFEVEMAKSEMNMAISELQKISKIGKLVTHSLKMTEIMTELYTQLKGVMDLDVVGICVYEPDNAVLRYKEIIKKGIFLDERTLPLNDSESLAASCIVNRKMVYKPHLKNALMTSVLYFPLWAQNKVLGAFTVQSEQESAFSQKDIEMLSALTSYIAIAVNNSIQSELLIRQKNELELLSNTDVLTKLYNRRFMVQRLSEAWERYLREHIPFSLALMDMDFFKRINDSFGHAGGDYMLVETVNQIQSQIRPYDILARWGGEEFLLLMPNTSVDTASSICERIRTAVETYAYRYDDKQVSSSITIGLAESEEATSPEDLIRKADQYLYVGKETGRNKVVAYYEESTLEKELDI